MNRSDSNNYRQIFLNDLPLIDTRAPVEFMRGAFPASTNLPLMTDDERHQVGIKYKESGQEAAITLGRKLVDDKLQEQRTALWLEFAQSHPQGYLYCFRGGLRSRITQQWMNEAGVHYPFVQGGYKAMRRFLIDSMAENLDRFPLILISGRTGVGKTDILRQLPHPVDLEGLAAHRGSSFGLLTQPQPTPINFENRLSIDILKCSQEEPPCLFVEAEGRLIGRLSIPLVLWEKMSVSAAVVLETSMQERIRVCIQDYVTDLIGRLQETMDRDEAILQLGERHRNSLHRIRKRLGGVRHGHAVELLDTALENHLRHDNLEAYGPFIELLLKEYYDPMYDYQQDKRASRILFRGNALEIADWVAEVIRNPGLISGQQ